MGLDAQRTPDDSLEIKNLCARLRAFIYNHPGIERRAHQAADTIESLHAENDKLREDLAKVIAWTEEGRLPPGIYDPTCYGAATLHAKNRVRTMLNLERRSQHD